MADSDSLFYLQNQFYLGAYKNVARNPLPSPDSAEYLATLLYTARAHIALGDYETTLSILAADTEPSIRAVRALASYLQAKGAGADVESILEELRDLTIEVEGEAEGSAGSGPGVVKVAASTAFIKEGELEEALATLGAGTGAKDLECVSLIVQIYLSIHRSDLAKKEYDAARRHGDDGLLIQLIEASIGLSVGGNQLNTAYHIYDEQASAPGSSTNPAVISTKGVAYLLRGNLPEAETSFNEALSLDPKNPDALAGAAVAAQLNGKKSADEAFALLKSTLPNHPLVLDLEEKSSLFDQVSAQYAPSVAA